MTFAREIRTFGVPVRVSDLRPDTHPDQVVQKITAAMALVARYRPRSLRRMPHDMDLIWVREHRMCRAAFYSWPDLRASVLDDYFVSAFPEEQVASSIVHEAVHARLRSAGVPWTSDQQARAREERMCRRAELRFGLALPNGEPLVQRAQAMLLLDDEEIAPRIR